jgi:hypothetical protein
MLRDIFCRNLDEFVVSVDSMVEICHVDPCCVLSSVAVAQEVKLNVGSNFF